MNPFCVVRSDILQDSELLKTPAVIVTLLAISTLTTRDKGGYCYFKQETIADYLGKTRQAISSHLITLQKLGYIEIIPQNYGGRQSNNRYRVLFDSPLNTVQGELAAPQGELAHAVQGELAPKYSYINTNTHSQPLTRSDFLREIEKERLNGRFAAQTDNESLIALEAGNAWDYWEAHPEKKPRGNLVSGFSGFLRQSRAIKAAEKMAAKSKPSVEGEGVTIAQASQPWHQNIARKIGEAPARAWIYPLHHDGEQIIAPSAFIRDRVLKDYRPQIEAEFRRGIPIIVGQIPQEQSA